MVNDDDPILGDIEVMKLAMEQGLETVRDRNGRLVISGTPPPAAVLEQQELDWILRVEGTGPTPDELPGRKQRSGPYLSDAAWSGLLAIAHRMNYIHGGHGNVSELLEVIGQGKLVVGRPDRMAPEDDVQSHAY